MAYRTIDRHREFLRWVPARTLWGAYCRSLRRFVWNMRCSKARRIYPVRTPTIFKLAVYFNLIVVFVFIDKFVTTGGIETKITTVILGSAICLAEAWSSCGNALIINPNFPFLRLFRKALTGEIARKLNVNPEDVENILNSTKK